MGLRKTIHNSNLLGMIVHIGNIFKYNNKTYENKNNRRSNHRVTVVTISEANDREMSPQVREETKVIAEHVDKSN